MFSKASAKAFNKGFSACSVLNRRGHWLAPRFQPSLLLQTLTQLGDDAAPGARRVPPKAAARSAKRIARPKGTDGAMRRGAQIILKKEVKQVPLAQLLAKRQLTRWHKALRTEP
jgi:hypothetical protein